LSQEASIGQHMAGNKVVNYCTIGWIFDINGRSGNLRENKGCERTECGLRYFCNISYRASFKVIYFANVKQVLPMEKLKGCRIGQIIGWIIEISGKTMVARERHVDCDIFVIFRIVRVRINHRASISCCDTTEESDYDRLA
jgi:hypothetical protein